MHCPRTKQFDQPMAQSSTRRGVYEAPGGVVAHEQTKQKSLHWADRYHFCHIQNIRHLGRRIKMIPMNNPCYLSREPVSVMPGWKVGESGALMIAKERQEYLRPTTLQRTNLSFSSSERFHDSLVQVQVSRAPVIVDIGRKKS